MHTIHTTLGFIIDARPYKEADKMLSILTRDFGLVTATAQGIRFEKSKLRYYTNEYSFGQYSFVRGKEFWRLTNAQELEHPITIGKSGQEVIARIALLLKRLLQGEESHPELFDLIHSLGTFIHVHDDLNSEELNTLESLGVYQILNSLGYIGADGVLSRYANSDITVDVIHDLHSKRKELNQHINKALKESHL